MNSASPVISDEISPDRNIVDSMANDLKFSGRFNELENELLKFRGEKVNTCEMEAWHHLYGIAAFIRNDHKEAFKRFEMGLEYVPESQDLMFSLGQEYIFLNLPENAFKLFDQCSFPKVSRDVILSMSRFAYIYNKFEKGMNYLSGILNKFLEIKILDDHYLYTRGYPFFGTVIRYFASHAVLSQNSKQLIYWVDKIKENCSDYDFEYLEKEINAYISDNYSIFLDDLKKDIESNIKNSITCGYSCLKHAIFTAFDEDQYDTAIDIIDDVDIGEDEFPWLEDLKYLAQAKIANKFNSGDESFLIEEFLKYQPTLLSPDQAIEFGVLDYQEKLKEKVSFVK